MIFDAKCVFDSSSNKHIFLIPCFQITHDLDTVIKILKFSTISSKLRERISKFYVSQNVQSRPCNYKNHVSKYKTSKYIPFELNRNINDSHAFLLVYLHQNNFLFTIIKGRYKTLLLCSGFLFAPFAASIWLKRRNC